MIMNYYCDESCHLLKDKSQYMVIGTLYCSKKKARSISLAIRNIKIKHNLDPFFEIKSTKVSNGNIELYKDLIDFFLHESNLCFRAIIIDKTRLDHRRFNQTHDEWYYKMYYNLISKVAFEESYNTVYMDLKDVHSGRRCIKLQEILINSNHHMINFNVIPIDSKRSNIIQLSDLLIGLVCYKAKGLKTSNAKLSLIRSLENSLRIDISRTNYEKKLNIFYWTGE